MIPIKKIILIFKIKDFFKKVNFIVLSIIKIIRVDILIFLYFIFKLKT